MELGWIDFSKSERSKVLSVLDLLSGLYAFHKSDVTWKT